MTLWTSVDRWTCPEPECGQTVVVDDASTDEDAQALIRGEQRRHGREHAAQRQQAEQGRRR